MAVTTTKLLATTSNVYVSSGNTVISTMHFCNTDTVDRTFSLYVVGSGGTANANTIVYSNVVIPPSDTYVISKEPFVFQNGDFMAASGNVANVIITTVTYASV